MNHFVVAAPTSIQAGDMVSIEAVIGSLCRDMSATGSYGVGVQQGGLVRDLRDLYEVGSFAIVTEVERSGVTPCVRLVLDGVIPVVLQDLYGAVPLLSARRYENVSVAS